VVAVGLTVAEPLAAKVPLTLVMVTLVALLVAQVKVTLPPGAIVVELAVKEVTVGAGAGWSSKRVPELLLARAAADWSVALSQVHSWLGRLTAALRVSTIRVTPSSSLHLH
jgi:hypothetical protein